MQIFFPNLCICTEVRIQKKNNPSCKAKIAVNLHSFIKFLCKDGHIAAMDPNPTAPFSGKSWDGKSSIYDPNLEISILQSFFSSFSFLCYFVFDLYYYYVQYIYFNNLFFLTVILDFS
jgi:hypothetical protein